MRWIERLGPAPSRHAFIGFTVGVILAAAIVKSFTFVPIIDNVNFVFHEAGHQIFGFFGTTILLLGGGIGQMIFPVATTVHFLRRRQLLSAACCTLWGFESLRNTAIYVGDARAQVLPIIGTGHDWHQLLRRWGLLESDTHIAGFLTFTSWSGWIAVWLIVYLRYRQGAEEREINAEKERRAAIIQRARESERIRQSKRHPD